MQEGSEGGYQTGQITRSHKPTHRVVEIDCCHPPSLNCIELLRWRKTALASPTSSLPKPASTSMSPIRARASQIYCSQAATPAVMEPVWPVPPQRGEKLGGWQAQKKGLKLAGFLLLSKLKRLPFHSAKPLGQAESWYWCVCVSVCLFVCLFVPPSSLDL